MNRRDMLDSVSHSALTGERIAPPDPVFIPWTGASWVCAPNDAIPFTVTPSGQFVTWDAINNELLVI